MDSPPEEHYVTFLGSGSQRERNDVEIKMKEPEMLSLKKCLASEFTTSMPLRNSVCLERGR